MQATGKLLLGLVLILGLCSTGLEASSARDKPDPNQRTYDSNVHLSNEGDFHHRLTRFFSLGRMISDFLDGHCSIPLCSHILKEIVAEVEPNIFGIYSLNTVNSSLHEMDLLIHLLSFPGSNSTVNSIIKSLFNIEVLPATAVSYFSASAHFNHDFSDSEIDFESQAFLLLQSYSQVIEFQDANNNKLYDAGEELQVIDLGIAGWTTSQASTVDAGSGVTVYHITSTTSDNVFSFACDTSTYPVQDNLGQVISPNATKCSLSIDSFPFKGTNSLLALTMNVVLEGGQFSASASGIISGNTLTVQNTAANVIGGEFTWVSSVSSSGTDFPVAASVAAGSSTGVVDVLSQFAVKDSSLTVKDSKTVTFTFQTSANPTQVTWDPSVVYGQSPVVDSSSSVLRASLLSLLAAIFAFYWAF